MKSRLLSLTVFYVCIATFFIVKNRIYTRLHISDDLGIWCFAITLLTLTYICIGLDNKNLSYIGLDFSATNVLYFLIGLVFSVFFALLSIWFIGLTIGSNYYINPNPDLKYILGGLTTTLLPFVIIEELLLRGFAYRKMIELTNLTATNTVFCIAVVIAHWYWWQVWGNYERMFLTTITASGHLLLSYAFLKSKTVYFPFSLHLFGNWTFNYIISSNIPSKSIFVIDTSQVVTNDYQPYINFGIGVLINILMMVLIYLWFNKQSQTIHTN